MVEFLIHNMAPIMFASLVIILLLGYPVAFLLAANGLIFAVLGIELGLFQNNFLQALPERVFGTMNNDTLLAIPFFTFMGLILERSGMAEDLLDTIGQLFGSIRGGLAYAVIFVGALLAATTGVVAASVISMGLISLPIMLRYGYDRKLASGVIAASGTLAQIIPPSLVLIVLADQLGRSVGDMYAGAIIPGMVLTGLYVGYVMLMTIFFPGSAPALPEEARTIREDPQLVPRQGVLSAVLLFIVAAAVGAGLSGMVANGAVWVGLLSEPPADLVRWVIGGIVGIAAAAYAVSRLGINGLGDAPRFNTLMVFGLAVILTGAAVAELRILYPDMPRDNAAIWGTSAVIAVLYLVAVVNTWLKLGLLSEMATKVIIVLVPPLALIFLVLGTIFVGIATPTEGGAMGATGALILAFAKGRLKFDLIRQAVDQTARLSAFVLFILIGARVFSLTFYGVNGHKWVEELLVGLPGGEIGFLIVVNILVFLLAFFLDFFELAFIIVPLLVPAAEALGIDLVWFGILLGINMQTSFMHPPFGFALFFLRSVAPLRPYIDKVTKKEMAPVTTAQIYWGAVPFVCIQIIMVALTIMFPGMVMHYKGDAPEVDPATIQMQGPAGLGFPGGFGTPGGGPGVPGLGGPAGIPGLGGPAPGGAPAPGAPAPGGLPAPANPLAPGGGLPGSGLPGAPAPSLGAPAPDLGGPAPQLGAPVPTPPAPSNPLAPQPNMN